MAIRRGYISLRIISENENMELISGIYVLYFCTLHTFLNTAPIETYFMDSFEVVMVIYITKNKKIGQYQGVRDLSNLKRKPYL